MPTATATTTSSDSVAFDPVILRETGKSRLSLRPTMVNNAVDAAKPVKGELVYHRKQADGSCTDANMLDFRTMKAGDSAKIALSTDELFDLTQAVRGLYGFFWKNNRLPATGEQIDLGQFAVDAASTVGNPLDLVALLATHVSVSGLADVVRWITETAHPAEALRLVSAMDEDKLAKLNSLAGVAALRKLHTTWAANVSNADEEFWQRLFAEHSFALSQLLTVPVVVIATKPYIGGKSIDNQGGKYGDFLMKNIETGHVSLIEIKSPTTKLLGGEYRTGVYGPSKDVAGAVTQVAVCKDELTKSYYTTAMKSEVEFRVADPHCVIITGHTSELNQDKKSDSFELFRRNLRGVEIITFDELFRRVAMLADMLEGIAEQSTDDSAVDTAESESNCS